VEEQGGVKSQLGHHPPPASARQSYALNILLGMSDFPPAFDTWSHERQERFYKYLEVKVKAEAEAEVRKAEAEARKAEAEAEARKAEAEAEVRKAELENESRSVGFECFPIKVMHWQRLVSHYVEVPKKHYSLAAFRYHVRLAFNDEINTDEFRLYLLPCDYNDVNQRILVDAARYEEFMASIRSSSSRQPSLYVWNYDEASPAKLPGTLAKIGSTSDVSRSSGQSDLCRATYPNCLCCGYSGDITIEAAHIFDIGIYNRLKKDERVDTLNALGLAGINQLANLIGLCKSCHNKFDHFHLGIDPTEKRWIVSQKERRKKPDFHLLVHGKKVVFHDSAIPPEKTLAWKWDRFIKHNKAYFCCYCDGIFPVQKSTKFQIHFLECQLEKNAKIDETKILKTAGGAKKEI
jgi:5-methylcytosine-specific restriction endonuclease McrA